MKTILIYSIMLLLFLGCVEPFDLELDKVKPRLVVQGLIENNAGPHFIRLIESSKENSTNFSSLDDIFSSNTIIGINNAIVTISDNTGQIEQLTPLKDLANKGFYKTTSFVGIVGRTYYLKITTKENNVYEASDYMKPISKIDAISFKKVIGEVGKFDYYAPILHFKDPQKNKENKYLVQFEREESIRNRNVFGIWEFATLSDKYFGQEKEGVSVDNGGSPRDFGIFTNFVGDNIYVRMNSLSDNAYDYYNNLLAQYEQDGGAYKPSPASPPTNISNSGLGFFRASAIAEAETVIVE